MSCFKLTEYLLNEIEFIIARFWWGDGQKVKIHWIMWDLMCGSKRGGGLGQSFNIAMLGKLIW